MEYMGQDILRKMLTQSREKKAKKMLRNKKYKQMLGIEPRTSTLVASPGGRLTKTRNCTLLSNTKQNLSTQSAKKSLKMT